MLIDPAARVRYAGFWLRFASYLVDQIVVFIAAFASGFFGGSWKFELFGVGDAGGWAGFALAISVIAYYVIGTAYGRTLGKFAVGLRVIDIWGHPPGLRRSVIRYLVSIFSGLVFAYGYWRMVFDDRKQTWHDGLAGTYVVRRR